MYRVALRYQAALGWLHLLPPSSSPPGSTQGSCRVLGEGRWVGDTGPMPVHMQGDVAALPSTLSASSTSVFTCVRRRCVGCTCEHTRDRAEEHVCVHVHLWERCVYEGCSGRVRTVYWGAHISEGWRRRGVCVCCGAVPSKTKVGLSALHLGTRCASPAVHG